MDDGHLGHERLSRLLDELGADQAAEGHLEACRTCTRELERLRRLRMALSGMGEQEPPSGEWARIEAGLRDAGVVSGGAERQELGPGRGLDGGSWYGGWPARVAAAVLVFGIGVAAGLRVDAGTGPDAGDDVASSQPSLETSGADSSPADYSALLTGAGMSESVSPVEDPVTAAEELARLDALASAVRERLRESPADPDLNNLLFQIADRQESLTREFGQAAHLVSLDYR